MNRSLKTLEAERERLVTHYMMALELSDTPIKVALRCSRETTLIDRDTQARLEWLKAEGDRFMAEAETLLVAGAPSHDVIWRSSLGMAACALWAGRR